MPSFDVRFDFRPSFREQECPKIDNLTDAHTLVTYDGLFRTSESFVTSDDIHVADYSASNDSLTCTQELCYPDDDPEKSYTSWGVNRGNGFAYYALDTYEVLWRCVSTDEANDALQKIVNPNGATNVSIDELTNNGTFKQGYNFWSNLYADLWLARYFILGLGFGAPLVRPWFQCLSS